MQRGLIDRTARGFLSKHKQKENKNKKKYQNSSQFYLILSHEVWEAGNFVGKVANNVDGGCE